MSNTVLVRPDDHASTDHDHAAVIDASSGETITYRQLADRSLSVARGWARHGLQPGDHVAVLMSNVPEYFEVVWGARRSGFYYTAVNWHLTPAEVRYILENSQARALVVTPDLAAVAAEALQGLAGVTCRVVIGPAVDGFEAYDDFLQVPDGVESPEIEGQAMLYSSGTTGRPKGIIHDQVDTTRVFGDIRDDLIWQNRFGLDPNSVSLSVGPLYHAAPLVSAMQMHRRGGTVVLMRRFDAEATLANIERYRVNFVQFVPTMFVRMLRLPQTVRHGYDMSSLTIVVHAAAPCPIPVKRAMIDWFGPILFEYYSATEAAGQVAIAAQEWLDHPGSVGRPAPGEVVITDDHGQAVPAGQDGTIWFTQPANRFSYHDDPDKTAGMYNDRGWARMGDLGHLDQDGYLYLTGRSGHTIISGGINIYPQEVENLLIEHPLVDDVAVFGVPDDEFGEAVRAAVTLRNGGPGDAELEAELIAWTRSRLAHYKCPRSIVFVEQLPRTDAGKMAIHRLIREPNPVDADD